MSAGLQLYDQSGIKIFDSNDNRKYLQIVSHNHLIDLNLVSIHYHPFPDSPYDKNLMVLKYSFPNTHNFNNTNSLILMSETFLQSGNIIRFPGEFVNNEILFPYMYGINDYKDPKYKQTLDLYYVPGINT